MSLLNLIGITNAYATNGTGTTENSLMSMLPILIIFVAFFYFLIIRPQTKRAKEHQSLISNLKKDDEVITGGGLLGKITKIADNFVVIKVSENVEIPVQKSAVSSVMPKGTIKSV